MERTSHWNRQHRSSVFRRRVARTPALPRSCERARASSSPLTSCRLDESRKPAAVRALFCSTTKAATSEPPGLTVPLPNTSSHVSSVSQGGSYPREYAGQVQPAICHPFTCRRPRRPASRQARKSPTSCLRNAWRSVHGVALVSLVRKRADGRGAAFLTMQSGATWTRIAVSPRSLARSPRASRPARSPCPQRSRLPAGRLCLGRFVVVMLWVVEGVPVVVEVPVRR